MGLWGAAQAVAFGLGGMVGTAASDLAHWLMAHSGSAYATVFALEALLFLVSARLALQIRSPARHAAAPPAEDTLQAGSGPHPAMRLASSQA